MVAFQVGGQCFCTFMVQMDGVAKSSVNVQMHPFAQVWIQVAMICANRASQDIAGLMVGAQHHPLYLGQRHPLYLYLAQHHPLHLAQHQLQHLSHRVPCLSRLQARLQAQLQAQPKRVTSSQIKLLVIAVRIAICVVVDIAAPSRLFAQVFRCSCTNQCCEFVFLA